MIIEKKINEYVEAGVKGYILKDCKIEDFLNTIAAVASGKEVIPCYREIYIVKKIIKSKVNVTKNSGTEKSVKMTKRERQVINLISIGTTNKEISKLLHLSSFKLKNHIHDIFEKVSLHSRLQVTD